MSRVYWDSMVFVYWLENHPQYAPRAEHIFRSMQSRGDQLCTSYLTMGEVLAGPLKRGQLQMARRLSVFLTVVSRDSSI